jgi:hypothetical protein
MRRTQSLIGGLIMCKGYAMYYHVEMSQISCVNLQMGRSNEKVQDFLVQNVWCIFMEHRKKMRGSGEPIQRGMVSHSIAIIVMLFVWHCCWPGFLGPVILSYPMKISSCEYNLEIISQPVLFIACFFSLSVV